MILGQLTMGARQAKNAPLQDGNNFEKYQVMLPTGGLLLMSLAPYTDTDTGYRVTR